MKFFQTPELCEKIIKNGRENICSLLEAQNFLFADHKYKLSLIQFAFISTSPEKIQIKQMWIW